MYKEIYVPVDNSDYSNQACVIGVDVARQFGGRVAGCHAYAAKMHDVRFRQMESGLPEEFRDEDEMKRQRKIHDQLITKGLEIITDSYIDVLEPLCEKYDVELVRRSLEGKNFKVIVEDVNDGDYDLVVIGAMGMAAVRDTVLGTVTERVVRRVTHADTLIVKDLDRSPFEHIVVAVDGSPKSLGGLKRAIELAREFGGTVEAISVFDPYFHYAMFHSIAGVLSSKAQKVFRFKEQEKLHEEIIDSGLAKIYTAHLEVAKKIAEDEGVDLKTTLLAGKPFEQTMKYVNEVNPTLVVMGPHRLPLRRRDGHRRQHREHDALPEHERPRRQLRVPGPGPVHRRRAHDLDRRSARKARPHPRLRGRYGDRCHHPLRHRARLHGNNERRHRRRCREHPAARRDGVHAGHRRSDA